MLLQVQYYVHKVVLARNLPVRRITTMWLPWWVKVSNPNLSLQIFFAVCETSAILGGNNFCVFLSSLPLISLANAENFMLLVSNQPPIIAMSDITLGKHLPWHPTLSHPIHTAHGTRPPQQNNILAKENSLAGDATAPTNYIWTRNAPLGVGGSDMNYQLKNKQGIVIVTMISAHAQPPPHTPMNALMPALPSPLLINQPAVKKTDEDGRSLHSTKQQNYA